MSMTKKRRDTGRRVPSELETPGTKSIREEKDFDPDGFDRIAKTIFASVYPAIAAQIIEETGIYKGVCIDIGCGGGYLGLALARRGAFTMTLLDPSVEMRRIAMRNSAEASLSDRVHIIEGSAEAIPLPGGGVDLAVSRGSVFFWKDPVQAFKEIHRILKPKGVAYIGGGFGSMAIREEISGKMKERDGEPSWRRQVNDRIGPEALPRFRKIIADTGIPGARVSHDASKGLWITFIKEVGHGAL